MSVAIVELAAWCDEFAAAEDRLFVAYGHWAHQPAAPGVQRRCAAACLTHGERAAAWRARRPQIPGLAPAPVMGGVADPNLGAIADLDATDANAASLLARYRAARERIDERLDAPTARLLDTILATP